MTHPEQTPATLTWRRRSGRIAWRVARFFLLLYGSILLLFLFLENSLVYFPAKFPAGDWDTRGLQVEDAEFTAADGTQLHGWYAPVADPVAVVLYCHGNAGNVTDRYEIIRELQRHNVAVLVFDYRGYGKSAGAPSEAGVLADARAARKWLAEKTNLREENHAKTFVSLSCRK